MPIFAEKPKTTQQATSTKPKLPGPAYFGPSRAVSSILHLQRMIGNQAVQQMLEASTRVGKGDSTTEVVRFGHDFSPLPIHPKSTGRIQAKRTVSLPGDSYEQEADQVSEPHLQRACTCGGRCPKCQPKQPDDEQEHLQTKRVQANPPEQVVVPPRAPTVLSASGQLLTPATWSLMEPRFGDNFNQVKVSSDSIHARRLDVTETTESPGSTADDPYCLHTRPGEGSERCEFTPKQQQTLSAVRYAALSLTSQALMNLSRGDPYMTTLARRIFHTSTPNMDQIRTTTSQILDNLRSKPIVCGTCADEDCYTAGVVAHVTDDLSTVILCQRFFQTSLTQMRRTLIHEAGHAAGVDSSPGTGPETYCAENSEGCVDPCSNLSGDLSQNVDAWARFIECAAHSG